MLAFSTNWNSHRHEKGGPMLREIEELGFQWVELGHGIKAEATAGIIKYLAKANLKVCSVHNYCPLPSGLPKGGPDFIELTASQLADRKRAVQKTKETIDFAAQLGATVVVLHLGSVEKLRKEETRLIKALEKGHRREVVNRKLKLIQLQGGNDLWERLHEGLVTLISYAKTKKIKLGIENRALFSELPAEDWEKLWGRYPDDTLGYWHDFGHAQVKEHLGWANHWESFTQKKEKLFGCHVHDASFPTRDHEALGQGRVPWNLLLPEVPRHIPWVMEYHPQVSSKLIEKDKVWLSSILRS